MPWKNGGGVTYEVAVFPRGAPSLDGFDWRVSMARVTAAGPFSLFPGIDRSLAILAGDGITLRIAGRDDVAIGLGSPPVSFAGDVPVAATLRAGPVTDLNVMTRRARWRHAMAREALEGDRVFAGRDDVTMVIVAGGEVALRDNDDIAPLCVRDALILSGREEAVLRAGRPPAALLRIALSRLA